MMFVGGCPFTLITRAARVVRSSRASFSISSSISTSFSTSRTRTRTRTASWAPTWSPLTKPVQMATFSSPPSLALFPFWRRKSGFIPVARFVAPVWRRRSKLEPSASFHYPTRPGYQRFRCFNLTSQHISLLLSRLNVVFIVRQILKFTQIYLNRN